MSTVAQADSDAIVPFWNRLPQIVRYPANLGSLATIIVLALGQLLVVFGLIGMILSLLAMVAMYRYAFNCLLASADGRLEPPEVTFGENASLGWRFIGLIIMLTLILVAAAIILGGKATMIVALIIAFALPAAIITLALEQSVFRALSPGKWFAIITRIGWPYLAVFGLCLVILFSQSYADAFVARIMPKLLAIILMAVLSNYAMVVTFHLMGYLVYQYHDELGFTPAGTQSFAPLARPDPDQDVLDAAAAHVQNGHPEDAATLLGSHLRGRGGTPKVHQQYRKLLRLADDNQGLLKHGREYLNILLAQGNDRAALELLSECQTLDPAFAPDKAETVTRLAHLAAKSGQARLALQLLSGFHLRFTNSPDVARNYLLAATLLHENLNQDEQARKLLLGLKANYPNSPLMPDIDARLAMIEKMLEATRKIQSKPRAPSNPAGPATPSA